MPTYYKTINGIKYDRELLAAAENLTTGRGDGRISVADAATLWKLAQDGSGITAFELQTLHYILENFNVTDKAAAFFRAQLSVSGPPINYLEVARTAGRKFGVERLALLKFSTAEIIKQEGLAGNTVPFATAIEEAFRLLFDPSFEDESPYHIIQNTYELYPGEVDDAHQHISGKLREHLSHGSLWLVPHGIEPDPNADVEFNPAENGETTDQHWVFYLDLPELSDHLYWTIIPRNGDAAYLYGFN